MKLDFTVHLHRYLVGLLALICGDHSLLVFFYFSLIGRPLEGRNRC